MQRRHRVGQAPPLKVARAEIYGSRWKRSEPGKVPGPARHKIRLSRYRAYAGCGTPLATGASYASRAQMRAVGDLQHKLDVHKAVAFALGMLGHHRNDIGFGLGNGEVICASAPRAFSVSTRTGTSNRRLDSGSHSTSINLSASMRPRPEICGQSCVWMTSPDLFFDQADDGVARDWRTATGKLDGHAFGATDGHRRHLAPARTRHFVLPLA